MAVRASVGRSQVFSGSAFVEARSLHQPHKSLDYFRHGWTKFRFGLHMAQQNVHNWKL